MTNAEIRKLVSAKMGGWNGMPPTIKDYEPLGLSRSDPVSVDSVKNLANNWREFGIRVRRDILMLEQLLIDKGVLKEAELYRDPGDPPPPVDV